MGNDMNVNQSGTSPVNFDQLRALYDISDEKDLIDILLHSTIAQSPEQAVMILHSLGIPVLQKPAEEGTGSVAVSSVASMTASRFSEIGSDMWDSYMDYLDEQKERIAEYLDSPQYRQKLEVKSPAYNEYVERSTPIDNKSQARNATGYQEWLSTLPPAARDEEVGRVENQIHAAKGAWTDLIDATSSSISNYRDDLPEAASFMAASFVICSSFIGDYMNIVDVASTNMVAVNPVQNAAAEILPLVPQSVQEQVTLAINFFAVGLINFANAETIGNQLKSGGEPPTSREAVLSFANGVINKVQSNEVNYFLMALLVSNVEKGEITPGDVNHLTRVVKVAMIAVALAALYKFEAGEISGQEFAELLSGKMVPRTEEERELVKLLQEIYGEGVASQDGEYESQWGSVLDGLVSFILSKPSVEDLTDQTQIWQRVGSFLQTPEQRG